MEAQKKNLYDIIINASEMWRENKTAKMIHCGWRACYQSRMDIENYDGPLPYKSLSIHHRRELPETHCWKAYLVLLRSTTNKSREKTDLGKNYFIREPTIATSHRTKEKY